MPCERQFMKPPGRPQQNYFWVENLLHRFKNWRVRTDRRSQSHSFQCTTSREGKQILRMAVTDRSDTSRAIAQYIKSVTHHSVSAHTIRRHLQQSGMSARRPLLGLPLTQNHRRPRYQC
ncbi:transposable element Tcb1 transposase [Trichonephila clavipes]|nr:transposable element Tcb1 transposase [Trichonephila clavipes]